MSITIAFQRNSILGALKHHIVEHKGREKKPKAWCKHDLYRKRYSPIADVTSTGAMTDNFMKSHASHFPAERKLLHTGTLGLRSCFKKRMPVHETRFGTGRTGRYR